MPAMLGEPPCKDFGRGPRHIAVITEAIVVVRIVAAAGEDDFPVVCCRASRRDPVAGRTRMGWDHLPVNSSNIVGIDCAQITGIHRLEPPLAVIRQANGNAIANQHPVAGYAAGMAEHRLAGPGRRLSPGILLDIVNLHQVDIAQVVPAADQVNITVKIYDRDGIIDRHRHRLQFMPAQPLGIEPVRFCYRSLAAIFGNGISAKNIYVPGHGGGGAGQPAFATGHIGQALPGIAPWRQMPGLAGNVLPASAASQAHETEQVKTVGAAEASHRIVTDRMG